MLARKRDNGFIRKFPFFQILINGMKIFNSPHDGTGNDHGTGLPANLTIAHNL